ncbi:MAG: M20/M25/M40 family metallo-hydrolase [Bacteroidales bacterium]
MKNKIIIIVIFTCCISHINAQQINNEITETELYNHIHFLASDSLKGRFPSTAEDKISALYIAQRFKESNHKLLFKNGLQEFEIKPILVTGEKNSILFKNKKFTYNVDFSTFPFSKNSELEAEIVFAGYGFTIKNDSIYWNDFETIDVKDKWVIILLGSPVVANGSSPYEAYKSAHSKAIAAKDRGAGGVIFVAGQSFDREETLINLNEPMGLIDIPAIQIKRDLANLLIKKSGFTIQDLENYLVTEKKPNSFIINEKIKVSTDIREIKRTTFNVVAELIVDTSANADYIVIGAHYDHLGFGGIGSGSRNPNIKAVHYGADDNASGVSSLLEIAQKLESTKEQHKSNFLFVAFGAEEMGLLGSKFFTNNLPVDKSQIKAMINIDMVGRMKDDQSLQIGGVGSSTISDSLANLINSKYSLKLGLSKEGYGPSDHSSFYSLNIPVFFVSTGPHTDYHTPGDSIGNINIKGLQIVTNYIYDLAFNLATTTSPIIFTEAGPKAPANNMGGRKMKVTLGIMPDFSGVEKRGLRIDLVIEGKAAAKAGLKTGDIIIAMDGLPVKDIYEYMDRLTKLNAGQIITIEVIRENENKVLIVQL